MMPSTRNVLFVTWDGPQTNYLEGLFLPIFSRLQEKGLNFHILQMGWSDAEAISRIRRNCSDRGMTFEYHVVDQSKAALGPFMSAVSARKIIDRLINTLNIDTVMPRSLMPALATMSSQLAMTKRIIFDADGFPADEKVDFGGLSKSSPVYLALRYLETKMTNRANHVLVRTEDARSTLLNRCGGKVSYDKFSIVVNGREKPTSLSIHSSSSDEIFRACYVGSFGEQYRPEQILNLVHVLSSKIEKFEFYVYSGDVGRAKSYLKSKSELSNVNVKYDSLPPDQLMIALTKCDLGIALRKPLPSMKAVSPIKIADYLLAGVPFVGTKDIGPSSNLQDKDFFFEVEENLQGVWPWVRDVVIPHRETLRSQAMQVGDRLFSADAAAQSYHSAFGIG